MSNCLAFIPLYFGKNYNFKDRKEFYGFFCFALKQVKSAVRFWMAGICAFLTGQIRQSTAKIKKLKDLGT